jgi:hypothetical protein
MERALDARIAQPYPLTVVFTTDHLQYLSAYERCDDFASPACGGEKPRSLWTTSHGATSTLRWRAVGVTQVLHRRSCGILTLRCSSTYTWVVHFTRTSRHECLTVLIRNWLYNRRRSLGKFGTRNTNSTTIKTWQEQLASQKIFCSSESN